MVLSEQNRLEMLKKSVEMYGQMSEENMSERNLRALLSYELENMGENENYDMSVMNYCVDTLNEKYPDENSEAKKQEIYDKIKEKINNLNKSQKAQNKFNPAKRILIACIVTILSTQVIAGAVFHENFIANVYNWTKEIFLMLIGKDVNQENTNFAASGSKQYSSVKELEKAENITILTPSWLPGGTKIKNILYSKDYKDKLVSIIYERSNSSLIIDIDSGGIKLNAGETYEIYRENDIDFYIYKSSGTISWLYKNSLYFLTCKFEEDESIKIIENIK